jgi:pimeloyl-ACP methyl ester carboxylesterase
VRQYDRVVSGSWQDLPGAVATILAAATLRDAPRPDLAITDAADMRWDSRSWGNPGDPALVLAHGIMSDGGVYWRLGPALAAAGWHVIAVDLPAHGGTGPWNGRHALGDTAADLGAWIKVMGFAATTLVVVGHSWGGMVAASLPAAGLRPRKLILIDPPHLAHEELVAMSSDPIEHFYTAVESARARLRATYPSWSDGDVEAKARALTRFDPNAAAAILGGNGDWDAGLEALADPVAAGVAVRYVRGEPGSGGLIPDEILPELAARAGSAHVLTIAGGSHSPMRTRDPSALAVALLRALEA